MTPDVSYIREPGRLLAYEAARLLGKATGNDRLSVLADVMRGPEGALRLRIEARLATRRIPEALGPGEPWWWDDADRAGYAWERNYAIERATLLANHARAASEGLTRADISALTEHARELARVVEALDISAHPHLREHAIMVPVTCETIVTLASDPWYWDAPVELPT